MKQRNGVLVAGAALAALAGCGSSPAKSTAPATASAACTQLLAASAARAARCSGGPVADWMAYEASFNDCAAYDGHVAAGEVQYKRDQFDACLAEYDLPCDHSFNCFYEVLHGLTADGQRCRDTEVCGTDSACFSFDGTSCSEVCLRGGLENETCGFYCGGPTPCLDFPFCRYDLVCSGDNVCVKGKSVGATCTGADPSRAPCRRSARPIPRIRRAPEPASCPFLAARAARTTNARRRSSAYRGPAAVAAARARRVAMRRPPARRGRRAMRAAAPASRPASPVRRVFRSRAPAIRRAPTAGSASVRRTARAPPPRTPVAAASRRAAPWPAAATRRP